MAWVRSGECCRCGQCCKGDPWDDPEMIGPRPREAVVAGMCPLFELHHGAAKGEGFCVGHEPPDQHAYYLTTCAAWPSEPAQLADKPSCSYTFTWVE